MAVTLTEPAARRVQQFIRQNDGSIGLRVAVKVAGCSGYSYIVDLAKEGAVEKHMVFEDRGVKIYVEHDSLPYLDGLEVDYKHEGPNSGFAFNNPNVTSTCGCGTSFNVQ